MLRSVSLLPFVLLAGCGSGSGVADLKGSNVSGKITVAGKGPLSGGTIRFVSATAPDKVITASIGAEGTYQVMGVAPGEYKVSIDNSALQSTTAAGGAPGMPVPKYIPIDRKYAKPESSGLSTAVAGSTHTYDVELK